MLQTIGKFIDDQLKPPQKEIADLKAQVEELKRKGISYKGIYQKSCQYAVGDMVSFEHSVWCCIHLAQAGELPGAFPSQWQMALRGDGRDTPRQPTRGGPREANMMTLDEAMAQAAAVLDDAYSHALEQAAEALDAHGDPTEQERKDYLQMCEQMLQANRAENIAKLRDWLQRGCKTLQ